jgi:hypothetical protein
MSIICILYFCTLVGATQVKWNKLNEWIVASSHDTDIRIWDMRKGSAPVTHITAHMTKIYGIDWNPKVEHEIITCSQDQFVKVCRLSYFPFLLFFMLSYKMCPLYHSFGTLINLGHVKALFTLRPPYGERDLLLSAPGF